MATITVTSLADSGAGSLRQAVSNANSGDTIAFAANLAGQTITLTSGQLEVTAGKNLTVDGANSPGLTISGNNASRIFHLNPPAVNPTQLTVKNVTLANAYTPDVGGAIYSEFQGQLVVENVNFNNNTADRGGGAIYNAFDGTLSVTGSTFDGNVAIAGNDERGAGAIAFLGPNEITIRDSEFTNNRGINGAAINSLQGELTIENSRFINNDTTAAFYDTGNLNPFLRGYGGALYTDLASTGEPGDLGSIRILNSTFEGNRGRGEGGAAYLFTNDQDEVIIDGSTFRNNQVSELPNGGNTGAGGAVVQLTNGQNRGFTITNSSFVNNTAAATGGGVWAGGTPVTIANSTFSGNRAEALDFTGNGGGLFLLDNPATITNSTFANNYAGWVGGAILGGDNVTVANTIFSKNTAVLGGDPGVPPGFQQHTNREFNDGGNNIQSEDGDKATTNITIADPLLGSVQNIDGAWVHPLLPGSPAIDAGNGSAPATDQRGVARQDGDLNGSVLPDIGAYEAGGNPPPAAPEIEILDGTTNILDGTTAALDFGTTAVGTPISKTFTIRNTGTSALDLSNLTLPNGFSVVGNLPGTVAAGGQANLQIQLDGTTAGAASGELSVVTNDSDENPFNFAISGNVTAAPPPAAPEIEILDGTTNILDGTTAALDFGTTAVGTPISKTFTIRNTGTSALDLSNLTLPNGFSVVGNLPGTVAAGGQANLQIQLDGTTAGAASGELSVVTNDSDENPFNFAISGNVTAAPPPAAPEIEILDGTTNILDGTTAALDFGTTAVGTPISKTFTIRNTGTSALDLSNLTLPNGFSVVGNLPGTVAAGGQANLQIQLDGTTAGAASGELSVVTNDSDENPFNFAISGNVTAAPPPAAPEIEILDGTTNILDGTTAAIDFGSVDVGGTLTKTFTVRNTGTADLTLPNDPTLPTGFSLVGDFPSAISPGSEATFTVQLDTAAAGTFNGTLSFGNNDSDENPFDFPIEATVANPTTNTPPTLDQAIADRVDEVGSNFSLDISGNFSDADGDTLTYTATGLPDGLTLDPNSGVISGTLTQAGVSAIAVTVDDGNGGAIADDFNLTVNNPPNDGPGGGGTNPPGDNPGGGTPPNDGPGGGGNPPNPSTPFLKEIADKYLQLQGGASQLKFSLKQSNAGKFVHEMGVFAVDDALGRIDGIAPGEQGYLKAAFAKAKTLFSALPRNQFADMNFARQLGVEAGTRLGFYLVQNGTTDAVQAELAAGRTPNNVLLASAGYADITEFAQNGFTLAWEDATSGAAADFKDLLVDVELTTDAPPIGANLDSELLDLRGQADLLPANFTVNSEAAFNNTFGFYAIDDASGRINGLNPGDAGYAEAALQNRVETNAGLPGGKILAPFVVANGTAEDFLEKNAQNERGNDPMAYFSFLGANPDKAEHIRMLGDNTFGVEDLYGGGDRDFNDLVVRVDFA